MFRESPGWGETPCAGGTGRSQWLGCGEQEGERGGRGGWQVDIWEFGLGDLGGQGVLIAGRGGQDLSKGTGAGDGGALGITQPGPSWDHTLQTGPPGLGLTLGKAEVKVGCRHPGGWS